MSHRTTHAPSRHDQTLQDLLHVVVNWSRLSDAAKAEISDGIVRASSEELEAMDADIEAGWDCKAWLPLPPPHLAVA